MDVRKPFLLGASILMLTACGPHMTKEEVIDYGEIGYSDIISYIVVGYQTNWEDMDPNEMNLSPVYTYNSKYAGSNSADDSCTKGYRIHKDKLKEVTGGWDRSLMPIELERFCDLARPQTLCGGYSEVREPDMDEYQLFREVTDTIKGMTFTPLTVQTQIVAGINYKFYCRFCDGSEEYNPGHCHLTIYKPLPGQGEPTLTSIEKMK